ncbi:MAG: CvpA family protein [Christensenellales bacterium]|jgi:uncharacterized membrane protein required for colicin V production
MNLLDLAILTILGLFVIAGIHGGFLKSMSGVVAFFCAVLLAYLIMPATATALHNNDDIYPQLALYTEGAERIQDFEDSKLIVADVDAEKIESIIESAKLPYPMDKVIENNINSLAFEQDGIFTMGEYFNESIVNFTVNLISFLLLFIVIRAILAFIIHGADYVLKFPVLRRFDGLVGGAFGLIQGIFVLFTIFSLAPLLITLVPVDIIRPFIESSFLGNLFYKSNFIASLIRGVI